MLKNYFKIAVRNLLRNKGFSATNILGLTIGMTCTMLILLWVHDEVGYDKFHASYPNIYQVVANRDFNNQIFTDRSMVMPLSAELKNKLPNIRRTSVTTHQQRSVLAYGDEKMRKQGFIVSEQFLEMFTWKFLQGNLKKALSEPNSIILTASTAKAFFGDAPALDKLLKVDNDRSVKVTAIVADVPGNSTFQFDYLMPFNYNDEGTKQAMNEWQNSSWTVFVETNGPVDTAAMNKAITTIKRAHGNDEVSSYFLFPMKQWRLSADFENGVNIGGLIAYVRLFTVIAIIILLIACINFMNLSTARSEKRAREVGVRKTLGSARHHLFWQFLSESLVLTVIAFVLAMIAMMILLPSFNQLVDKQIAIDFANPWFWLSALVIILLTGMIAGSYPALYLSSFNPVKVLKGVNLTGKKTVLPRHILVVCQFVISILLISATIVVYQQLQYVKNRDMGYNPSNLLMIPATPDTDRNYAVIKQELLATGLISGVTRTSSPITEVWWNTGAPDYNGKPPKSQIIMGGLAVDKDFSTTMGVKLVQGRDFSGTPADSSSMLLNLAAVKAMGLKEPIGMQMRYNRNFTVIGVTSDIMMTSPYAPAYPMMMMYQADNSSINTIRLKEGINPKTAIASIESTFKKYNPAAPFEYQFVDQEFQRKFLTEELIGRLTNIFSGLAIFLCCLGLAGLASFTIQKRIREIGVRKVLGATIQQLLLLISKEFLKLVLVAFFIAVPLTYWIMSRWLSNYQYRTTIQPWIFPAVGGAMLLLTLIVVSLNTAKAALRNPVKSLRTE